MSDLEHIELIFRRLRDRMKSRAGYNIALVEFLDEVSDELAKYSVALREGRR